MTNNNILCSFCGANQVKVDILIEGDSAYICNNCIIKSYNVISESKYDKETFQTNMGKPLQFLCGPRAICDLCMGSNYEEQG